ncbi:HAD family hydrolase [Cellulosimicrobium composti]|uniref:HAD family hydrolase n=1 Tax=Cellulosimicrobium composti TaxID=2672572 RepID=UPI0037B03133
MSSSTVTLPSLADVGALALDVDGTLAGADHTVSPRTAAAVARVRDAGVPVLLVTGRSRANTLALAGSIGLDLPVVCCNGAVVVDPRTDEDLRVETLAPEEVRTMAELADELGLTCTWWTSRDIFISEPGFGRDLLMALNEQDVRVADLRDTDPGSIVKIMVVGRGDRLDEVAPTVSRVPRIARAMDEFFELSPERGAKWEGLSFVLDRLGVTADRTLGFGDGGNDVPWLSRIGYGFAMGNARPEVKAVTLTSIGHHAEDGLAAFLEHALDHLGLGAPRTGDLA